MSINLRIHILPDVPDDVDIRPPAWVEDTFTYSRAYRKGFADAAIQTRDLLADTVDKVGREQEDYRRRHLREGYFAQVVTAFATHSGERPSLGFCLALADEMVEMVLMREREA